MVVETFADRGSENAPIASRPTAGFYSPVVSQPSAVPKHFSFQVAVRDATPFVFFLRASHRMRGGVVVRTQAKSGPQPALSHPASPSLSLASRMQMWKPFKPFWPPILNNNSVADPLFHPASRTTAQRPSSRLETVPKARGEAGNDHTVLSDPQTVSEWTCRPF